MRSQETREGRMWEASQNIVLWKCHLETCFYTWIKIVNEKVKMTPTQILIVVYISHHNVIANPVTQFSFFSFPLQYWSPHTMHSATVFHVLDHSTGQLQNASEQWQPGNMGSGLLPPAHSGFSLLLFGYSLVRATETRCANVGWEDAHTRKENNCPRILTSQVLLAFAVTENYKETLISHHTDSTHMHLSFIWAKNEL